MRFLDPLFFNSVVSSGRDPETDDDADSVDSFWLGLGESSDFSDFEVSADEGEFLYYFVFPTATVDAVFFSVYA